MRPTRGGGRLGAAEASALDGAARGRRPVRPAWRAAGSWLLAVLGLPFLLFCAVAARPGAVCLDDYAWEPGAGWVPEGPGCGGRAQSSVVGAGVFHVRTVAGVLTGGSGLPRSDPSRPLAAWLGARLARSGAVLLAALAFAAVGAALAAAWRSARRRLAATASRVGPPPVPSLPAALPVPIAAFVVFVAVMRLVPPGSTWDWDRAAPLWAGLALALGDGVAWQAFLGLSTTIEGELGRPYADALHLEGHDPRPAAAAVTRRTRASLVRAALAGLVAGLPVVEFVFGIDGMGEAVRDLVVDRHGLDPLVLSGVLGVSGLALGLVAVLPLEPWIERWR